MKIYLDGRMMDRDAARIDPAELVSTSVETLLEDTDWREAILRIPVDVLLWNKFNREPQAGLLDRLARTCREAFGGDKVTDSLLKAASGRYAVGPSAPFSLANRAVCRQTGGYSESR